MKSFSDQLDLQYFPELEFFENEQEAAKALKQTRMKLLPHLFWAMPTMGLTYLAVSTLIIPLFPLPSLLSNLLFIGGFLATGFYGVHRPLRRWMSRDLRKQLNALGIPICLNCACDLRGQDQNRCPKCSTAFGASADAGGADVDQRPSTVPFLVWSAILGLIPHCARRAIFSRINVWGGCMLAGLLFFPWFDVSCSQRVVSSPSGFNLMTATLDAELKQTVGDLQGPRELTGDTPKKPSREEVLKNYFPAVRSAAMFYALVVAGLGIHAFRQRKRLPRAQHPSNAPAAAVPVRAGTAWITAAIGILGLATLLYCHRLMGAEISSSGPNAGVWTYEATRWFWLSALVHFGLCVAGVMVAGHVKGFVPQAVAPSPTAHSPMTAAGVMPAASPTLPATKREVKGEWGMLQMVTSFVVGMAIVGAAYVAILKYGASPQTSKAATPAEQGATAEDRENAAHRPQRDAFRRAQDALRRKRK